MKKSDKNNTKNLQVSKKSAKFAPEFADQEKRLFFLTPQNYTPIFENASSEPTPNLVPNEALGLRDLFDRTQRGQRLNVHTRMRTDDCPDNMYRAEYERDPKTGELVAKSDPFAETFDNVPPAGMNDITDVMAYSEEIAARKKELHEKRQKDIANARTQDPAPKPEAEKEKGSDEAKKEGA